MNSDTEATIAAAALTDVDTQTASPTPSENWVRAVSDFLDTDPADLLAELGYYDWHAGDGDDTSANK